MQNLLDSDSKLKTPSTILLLANVLLGVSAASALIFLGLPGDDLFWNSLQNSGHCLIFMLLTLVALFSFALYRVKLRHQNSVVVIALFLLGLIIEIGQQFTGRGASLVDIGMNSAGIAAGYSFFMATDSARTFFANGKNKTEIKKAKYRTCIFTLTGLLISTWCLRLPASYLIVEQLAAEHPVLANFNHVGAGLKILSNNATFDIKSPKGNWKTNKTSHLTVKFSPGIWPSVRFLEPSPDWSAYGRLTFLALNDQAEDIEVYVRIDDSTLGENDNDHMTVLRKLPTGESLVSIDFDEFSDNARRRHLPKTPTFTQMKSFMIFLPRVTGEVVLSFDDFRLE